MFVSQVELRLQRNDAADPSRAGPSASCKRDVANASDADDPWGKRVLLHPDGTVAHAHRVLFFNATAALLLLIMVRPAHWFLRPVLFGRVLIVRGSKCDLLPFTLNKGSRASRRKFRVTAACRSR